MTCTIGWDGGYHSNKTSEEIKFESKLCQFNRSLETDATVIPVLYNDKHYLIGKGSYETSTNKINAESTKIFMLTALALSSEERDYNVVTGLPIKQFKKQKDELKNTLLANNINYIQVGIDERAIIINDVYVFPQCLSAYYSLSDAELNELEYSNVLMIDIGGRTIDISLLKCKENKRYVAKYSTILEGTLTMYSDFIHEINAEFDTDLRVEDAEEILKHGLYISGIKKSLNFTKDIVMSHVNEIFKEIELKYPIKNCAIYLTGGGAYLYKGLFRKRYENVRITKNSQFANANGLKKVGEGVWHKS